MEDGVVDGADEVEDEVVEVVEIDDEEDEVEGAEVGLDDGVDVSATEEELLVEGTVELVTELELGVTELDDEVELEDEVVAVLVAAGGGP